VQQHTAFYHVFLAALHHIYNFRLDQSPVFRMNGVDRALVGHLVVHCAEDHIALEAVPACITAIIVDQVEGSGDTVDDGVGEGFFTLCLELSLFASSVFCQHIFHHIQQGLSTQLECLRTFIHQNGQAYRFIPLQECDSLNFGHGAHFGDQFLII